MCLLVESIRISGNIPQNLIYHNDRANRSRRELYGCKDSIRLEDWVKIPDTLDRSMVYKFRVIYNETFQYSDVHPYQKRNVRRLKIIQNDEIDYHLKYEGKKLFQPLLELKGNCDDILIVKDGQITDTSFSNIAFFDGTAWVTPNNPLLEGTKRSKLLHEGLIRPKELRITDLASFQKASLINAMLDLGEILLPLENIVE